MRIRKYPRTPHLEGSRLQPGDQDLSQVRLRDLKGHLVVEEKVDGANAGIRFDSQGRLLLQSRGHFLVGGPRERHFAQFKTWASRHRDRLWQILGDRYLLFGEWLYAKHTIFYDRLPHYFLEFDLFDTREDLFLDTPTRHRLLANSPVVSVPVLWRGDASNLPPPQTLVGRSVFKGPDWQDVLRRAAQDQGLDIDRTLAETDLSEEAEGLYIKVESAGETLGRLKWIRHSFLTSVLDSGSHWLARPILPNQLAPGVDLYA